MSLLLLSSDEDDGTTVSPSQTTANISHTENLSEKVVTLLYGEVVDEKTGEIVQTTSLFSFDPNEIPNHAGHSLSIDGDGQASLDALGDVDTGSVTYAFNAGTSPSAPSESDVDDGSGGTADGGGTLDGRDPAEVNLTTLSGGESIRLGVRGWTGSGTNQGTGTKSTTIWRESGSVSEGEVLEPDFDITGLTALDDGTDIDYTVNWSPNSAVADADNSMDATFKGTAGTVAATATESSPASTTQITATDSGAGDGSANTDDFHEVILELLDSSGNTIASSSTVNLEVV